MADPAGSNDTRALTAALANPTFVTRAGGRATHSANRHVERYAPEVGAHRVGSLRSLGFVDRLVSPWIEAAQRSASMRLFSQVHRSGLPERQTTQTSWLFPRPWYQDELDWMAAARESAAQRLMRPSPDAPRELLTTRGTYVAPAQRSEVALPAALYEYVAPSLSVAPPRRGDLGTPPTLHDAYSPLVSLSSVHAAHVMQHAIAPLFAGATTETAARMSPNLRAVLTTMLARSVVAPGDLRIASLAPELVTPPAPRQQRAHPDEDRVVSDVTAQRAQIAELRRTAAIVTERERVQRAGSERQESRQIPTTDVVAADRQHIEQQVAQRLVEQQPDQRREQQQQREQQQREQQQREQQQREQQQRREQLARVTQERVGERLHEQARDAAARDARIASNAPAHEPMTTPVVTVAPPVPQEIITALANLSPELAAVVASGITRHPDRAVQTITSVGEALRTIDLIARNSAAGGSFETARGPRLVMPAGLGGLVAAVDRNVAQRELRSPAPLADVMPPSTVHPTHVAAARAQSMVRTPVMAWLTPSAPSHAAPTTAFGATEAVAPAALHHIAWADRWLARFAGARARSLDLLTASSAASSDERVAAFASAAPGLVFVAPQFDATTGRPTTVPMSYRVTTERATPTEIPAALPSVRRYDDNEETPDDVFSAISAAAARTRAPIAQSTAATPAQPGQSAASQLATPRDSLADAVAHAVPSAPGAGLAAPLASSPFAAAFRHVFPLAAAPSFDVRSLFGAGLSAAYLAGLLAPATGELVTGAARGVDPVWLPAATAMTTIGGEAPVRDVADWSPTYVSPTYVSPAYVSPTQSPTHEPRLDTDADLIAATIAETSPAPLTSTSDQLTATTPAPLTSTSDQLTATTPVPITTMRSALLSWDVDSFSAAPGLPPELRIGAPSFAHTPGTLEAMGASAAIADSMIRAMAMPMLGAASTMRVSAGSLDLSGGTERVAAFAAPGMIADRAHAWSVAQERSSSDLSFDFVTPELVLAARVYGLGPAEAAQAMRLAIAGPGQLATMASTVDRTFVQAFAIEAERRDRAQRAQQTITAYPPSTAIASSDGRGTVDAGRLDAAGGQVPAVERSARPQTEGFEYLAPRAPTTRALAPASVATTNVLSSGSAFGIDRRHPRGAFTWPATTVAALGLTAATPDGDHSLPVAALELLAAQSVAALGTYAALGFGPPDAVDSPASASSTTQSASSSSVRGDPGEPVETDVITAATALVPSARRAKFEAMYVALGQSHSARSWSPAARAARALALAGRGDDTITAYERAQVAWDVLPLVAPTAAMAMGFELDGAPLSTGSAAQRAARSPRGATGAGTGRARLDLPDYVESRPGLGALSARAGEALTSYVSTGTPEPAPAARAREPVMRAPTAAPELIRGRPGGRYGGGEVEIPTWFEAAARKMLDERSGGVSEGISLAELTLVNAAPSQQIAASTRGVPSSAAPTPSSVSHAAGAAQQIDIERVANDVYKHVLVLMDAARFRNGEPHL